MFWWQRTEAWEGRSFSAVPGSDLPHCHVQCGLWANASHKGGPHLGVRKWLSPLESRAAKSLVKGLDKGRMGPIRYWILRTQRKLFVRLGCSSMWRKNSRLVLWPVNVRWVGSPEKHHSRLLGWLQGQGDDFAWERVTGHTPEKWNCRPRMMCGFGQDQGC